MKKYVATVLLTFALLASGCNDGQEEIDVSPVQTEDNSDRSMVLPKKDSEALNGNENPVIKKDSVEKNLDDGQSDPSINGQGDSPTNGQGDSPTNGQSDSPTNGQGDSPINGQSDSPTDPTKPQVDEPDDDPKINEPDKPEKKEPTIPKSEPEPSFLEDNIIPILAGIIVLLMIVVVVLLYKLNNKKSPPTHSLIPPKPPDTSKSPETSKTPPPPTFSVVGTSSVSSKRPAFLVGTLWNIGKREEQQDSFYVSSDDCDEQILRQKGLLAIVADGMGGLEGGARISKLVKNTFRQNYAHQAVSSTANFLYNTAAMAEKEVEKFIEHEGITGGSTLVAIMIKNNELNFLSVGDSHIYLFQDGVLTKKNREHNYGELLKEKARRGEVSEEEARNNSQRHSLTAYIGMGSFNIVDKNSQPIRLKPGDKVFLCSDGVYNALGNDALTALLRSDAITAAKKIEANIIAQNIPKQDNFTGVIVELYEK